MKHSARKATALSINALITQRLFAAPLLSGQYEFERNEENTVIKVSISKDFGRFPGGRVPNDGPHNGETFRKEHLVPALKKAMSQNEHVEVSLDDVEGYGSSFLEEAFGGLIREENFTNDQLQRHLKIHSRSASMNFYRKMILDYIKDAIAAKGD